MSKFGAPYKIVIQVVLLAFMIAAAFALYGVGKRALSPSAGPATEKWLMEPTDKWLDKYGDNDTTRLVYNVYGLTDLAKQQQQRIANLEKAIVALNRATGNPLKAKENVNVEAAKSGKPVEDPGYRIVEGPGYRIEAVPDRLPVVGTTDSNQSTTR